MTVRQTRQLLNAMAALCAVGCVGVLIWAFMKPSLPEPDTPRVRQPTASSAKTNEAIVSDDDISAVASRPLQGPLTLQQVAKPKSTPKPQQRRKPRVATAPRISLLATIFDENSRTAIVQDVRGLTDQKQAGQKLSLLPSGMTLEAVEADHVRVALRGQSFRIALKGNKSPARRTRPIDSFDDDEDEEPDMLEDDPPFVGEGGGMMKR